VKNKIAKTLDDEYVGEGIKKVKAFICSLTKDKLERYRQEFWGNVYIDTRIEGSPAIWKILNQACNASAAEAEYLLSLNSIKIYQNIQLCFDSTGLLYKLPRSVFHNPKSFFKDDDINSIPVPQQKKTLKVFLK